MDELTVSYYKEVRQEVLLDADANGDYIEDAYFERYCAELINAGELETADRVYFNPGGGVRVDGYGGDPRDSEGVLTLIVADFSEDDAPSTLTQTAMEANFKRALKFARKALSPEFRDGLEESMPAFGLADTITTQWDNVFKVRVILLTNKVLSSRIDSVEEGEVDDKPVSKSVWDLERLRRYVASGQEREELVVDFDGGSLGSPIPLLPAHSKAGNLESYLAVIPGAQLAAVYDRWGTRLLEQNVRVFLQARSNVNKGIKNTIDGEPEMFFAFNNGITATADEIETATDDSGFKLTRVKNLQIVNGGQTTASIHAAMQRKSDLSSVFVQMKLTTIGGGLSKEVVPRISEYANSQNKVSAADFFSNHPYHVRIEEFSRRLFAPSPDGAMRETKWFYERARGQYLDARGGLTPTQRKKFDLEYPKSQKFTKTDLAKYEMAWDEQPHVVSKGAQKNFAAFATSIDAAWEKDDSRFSEKYFREAVSKALMFKALEKLVSDQPWYDGGYRANIVAYTLSKLSFDIRASGDALDFERIWREQGVSADLESVFAHYAFRVHEIITNPDSRYRNVTEWAKQPACWNRVSKADFHPPSNISKVVVPKELADEARRDASKDQEMLSGIALQTKVVDAGPLLWRRVRTWGSSRSLLTQKEMDVLDVCASLPARVPTEKQCEVAAEALKRLRTEGCTLGRGVI